MKKSDVEKIIVSWQGRSRRTDRYDSQVDLVHIDPRGGLLVSGWTTVEDEIGQFTYTEVHQISILVMVPIKKDFGRVVNYRLHKCDFKLNSEGAELIRSNRVIL